MPSSRVSTFTLHPWLVAGYACRQALRDDPHLGLRLCDRDAACAAARSRDRNDRRGCSVAAVWARREQRHPSATDTAASWASRRRWCMRAGPVQSSCPARPDRRQNAAARRRNSAPQRRRVPAGIRSSVKTRPSNGCSFSTLKKLAEFSATWTRAASPAPVRVMFWLSSTPICWNDRLCRPSPHSRPGLRGKKESSPRSRCSAMVTTRSICGTASGRRTTASMLLNMAVLAPMPEGDGDHAQPG